MLMTKELRTVCNLEGVPVLEIVKEEDTITILEADDMDQQIKFPAALIPMLVNYLVGLR